MTFELMTALLMYCFATSITPGPNNIMLMNSVANFTYKSTIPHMLGVNLGFTFMVLLVGLGIMKLFDAYPLSYKILNVVSIAYLVYLALKIALSNSAISDKLKAGKPLSFIQAVMFQWVNPKAWTMAVTAISVYAPSQSIEAVIYVTIAFSLVNLPCINCWMLIGQKLKKWLSNQIRLRVFNVSMAILLLLSLLPAV